MSIPSVCQFRGISEFLRPNKMLNTKLRYIVATHVSTKISTKETLKKYVAERALTTEKVQVFDIIIRNFTTRHKTVRSTIPWANMTLVLAYVMGYFLCPLELKT